MKNIFEFSKKGLAKNYAQGLINELCSRHHDYKFTERDRKSIVETLTKYDDQLLDQLAEKHKEIIKLNKELYNYSMAIKYMIALSVEAGHKARKKKQ